MADSAVSRYGIVSARRVKNGLHRVDDLVEKPAPADAPSNLAVIGRYVLPPEIFPILRKTPPGKNGEIQLTDALRQLVRHTPMFARGGADRRKEQGQRRHDFLSRCFI